METVSNSPVDGAQSIETVPAVPDTANPPKALRTVSTATVTVPIGYQLPEGKPVERAFELTVQFGARWHQDWDAPRVSVIAFRMLKGGDAIGFSGTNALIFPVPDEVKALAFRHGHNIEDTDRAVLSTMGLDVPDKPDAPGTWVLPGQRS